MPPTACMHATERCSLAQRKREGGSHTHLAANQLFHVVRRRSGCPAKALGVVKVLCEFRAARTDRNEGSSRMQGAGESPRNRCCPSPAATQPGQNTGTKPEEQPRSAQQLLGHAGVLDITTHACASICRERCSAQPAQHPARVPPQRRAAGVCSQLTRTQAASWARSRG